MAILSENAVSQGMVLASLIGGIALASIAQLVSAFPNRAESADGGKDTVTTAITWLAVAATVMMINVWSGIIFFMDDGSDRQSIALLYLWRVADRGRVLRPGHGGNRGDQSGAAATADPDPVRRAARG